jgi:dienelactone hydrolase
MPIAQRTLEYRHGDQVFRGELAWDDAITTPRPGIVVAHEGGGINDHPKWRAALLAEAGYVALAIDMFGGGSFLTDPKARGERMFALRNDTSELRARAQAGLAALASEPLVDSSRLAAIGFCFGGLTVLELARSGAELAGVVSFHGILETRAPAPAGAIKAKILVLHGSEDPFAPDAQVAAFVAEMRAAQTDWQLVLHGGAQHGFTRRDAAAVGLPGVAYHEAAERRSWAAMLAFLSELFPRS